MVVSSGGSRVVAALFQVERNLRNAFHQVKLTLMIAAIGFSDDKCHSSAAALF
jgi:hypothetical protein